MVYHTVYEEYSSEYLKKLCQLIRKRYFSAKGWHSWHDVLASVRLAWACRTAGESPFHLLCKRRQVEVAQWSAWQLSLRKQTNTNFDSRSCKLTAGWTDLGSCWALLWWRNLRGRGGALTVTCGLPGPFPGRHPSLYSQHQHSLIKHRRKVGLAQVK